MSQLELRGVGKRYPGDHWGVRGVEFQADRGVIGLLGPNGAGKSTLLRILATVSSPTEGSVRWRGTDITSDPDAVRRELGYLPQDFGVYPHLSARQFLRYLAAAKGLGKGAARSRVEEVIEAVDLLESADRPLGTFSGGMRQRVGIGQALLNDPDLLIVDEPTVGLDPEQRARFRSLLAGMARERVVLLSTHIVSDVRVAADRVVLLHRRRMLADTSPGAMIEAAAGSAWKWSVAPEELAELRRTHRVTSVRHREDGVEVRTVAAERPVADATSVEPTLEDAYLWRLSREEAAA